MASLGGARAVGDACFAGSDAPPLELRCRPTDPLSHPLYGERAPTSGIVLRIARSKRRRTTATADVTQDDASAPASCSSVDPDVRVEAVGRVTHLVQFKGMADFQHTRAAEDPDLAACSGIAPVPVAPSPGIAASPRGHVLACGVPDGPKSDPFRLAERAEAALAGVPAGSGARNLHFVDEPAKQQQQPQQPLGGRHPGQSGRQPWVGSLVMVPPIYSKVDEPEVRSPGDVTRTRSTHTHARFEKNYIHE